MKQRNHAFDLLCGVCIIRMLSLHIMQFCGRAQDDWWQVVMAWSYFFMSFFFFKAGYFNKGVSGDNRTYLIDRTKRLFVPYLTSGTLGFLLYFAFYPFLVQRYHHPIEPLAWRHIWTTSSFYGNLPVWFLFSFFMMYVTVHFLERGAGHMGRWGERILPVIVCTMPWLSYYFYTIDNPVWMSLSNLPMGIFFFYLGRWWHTAIRKLGDQRTLAVSGVMVVLFIISNILWHSEYVMSSNRFDGGAVPAVINTILILCGLSGVLLTIPLPRIPGVCFIGEHSMVYFISHYPMLYYIKFSHLCYGRSIFGRKDEVLVLIPIIFVCCTWLVPYVENTPWLSGRWKQKEKKTNLLAS